MVNAHRQPARATPKSGASQISNADIRRVKAALEPMFGANKIEPVDSNSFRTGDGWQITIGGWHHGKLGWSRGFTVADFGIPPHVARGTRGYRGPAFNASYAGKGWIERMSRDIWSVVKRLRNLNELRCPLCGSPANWSIMPGSDPHGHADCMDGMKATRRVSIGDPPCPWKGGKVERTGPDTLCWSIGEPKPDAFPPMKE